MVKEELDYERWNSTALNNEVKDGAHLLTPDLKIIERTVSVEIQNRSNEITQDTLFSIQQDSDPLSVIENGAKQVIFSTDLKTIKEAVEIQGGCNETVQDA